MGLTNEAVGPKIVAKIKIFVLTRAKLLFNLCYEIPCNPQGPIHSLVLNSRPGKASKGFQWQQHFFTLFGTLIGTKLLYM